MEDYTKEEWAEALRVVTSTIRECEKIQPKFAEGSSQHSLLKNRISALYISKSLITGDGSVDKYSEVQLTEALPPVSSIISKCEKAILKFAEGTPQNTRLRNIIKAMNISKAFITDEIFKRNM